MRRMQRPGHWWGDDWALYIRQAQALLNGTTNRVAAENAFTVTQSVGPEFSPPLYPWGFPILLAPAIAAFGADLDRLAIVEIVCSCVIAVAWYGLARRRLGTIVAIVGMVAVTITPALLSWTELIQSELPFLAAVFSTLVAVDAALARGVFEPERSAWTRASWLWLVVIGFGAAAAFSIRREGLALVAAIAALQFVTLTTMPTPAGFDGRTAPVTPPRAHTRSIRASWPAHHRGVFVFRLALPHLVAAALVVGLQVVMPATVVPRYRGTSIVNLWNYRIKIAANLAEVSGFKRAWESQPEVFSNAIFGWFVVVIYLIVGLIGVVFGLTVWRRRDVHIAVYVLVALAIGGSFRSAVNRYVASVGPLLLLLGLCVVAAAVSRLERRWLTIAVPTLIVGAIVASNIANAHVRITYADAYAAAGAIEWGPTHPDAQAMFRAVIALSDTDDVVAAPKARAMVFETGRDSVQVDQYRSIPDDIEIDLVVVEQGSALARKLDKNDDYSRIWSNTRFAIFRPADPASEDSVTKDLATEDSATE